MESSYLHDFLQNVGHAVHNVNTICVGLASIEAGNYSQPSDLTITWATGNNSASARKARQFALKASLNFIDDSVSTYLKDIRPLVTDDLLDLILSRQNPQFNTEHSSLFKVKLPELYKHFEKKNIKAKVEGEKDKEYRNLDSAERIRALKYFFTFPYEYWIPCVVLLNKWRNRVIHQKSKASLELDEIKILERDAEILREKHSNIDIQQTLKNFNEGKITLKDFTTLIAISIKMVREIDNQLYIKMNNIKYIEDYVKSKQLISEYNTLLSHPNPSIRKRKFLKFVYSKITHLEEVDLIYIYGDAKPIILIEV